MAAGTATTRETTFCSRQLKQETGWFADGVTHEVFSLCVASSGAQLDLGLHHVMSAFVDAIISRNTCVIARATLHYLLQAFNIVVRTARKFATSPCATVVTVSLRAPSFAHHPWAQKSHGHLWLQYGLGAILRTFWQFISLGRVSLSTSQIRRYSSSINKRSCTQTVFAHFGPGGGFRSRWHRPISPVSYSVRFLASHDDLRAAGPA